MVGQKNHAASIFADKKAQEEEPNPQPDIDINSIEELGQSKIAANNTENEKSDDVNPKARNQIEKILEKKELEKNLANPWDEPKNGGLRR